MTVMKTTVIAAALTCAVILLAGAAGAESFQPTSVDMSDALVGLGGSGPYVLSWNNIAVGSESVEVNGVPLLRGIDYSVDYTRGTITFAHALSANSGARIAYLRQPGQSRPNEQPVELPAAIPLGSLAGADLSLALRFQQQPAQAPSGVYGLRAGRSGATKVDAALFFSTIAGSDGRSEGGSHRAAGWRIGAQRSYSQLDLAASLTRAEQGFTAPNDLPAPAGMQTLNVAANYRATPKVTATASLTNAENIASPDRATTQTHAYGLAARPLAGADVSITRSEVDATSAAGSTSTITDNAQANLAVGSARASASYQQTVAAGVRSEAQSLSLASKLGRGLNLTASHSEASSASSRQSGSEVGLDIAAWRQARLKAIAGARRGDEFQDYRGVEATLQPGSALTLSGAYKQRDYRHHGLDTRRAAITLSPIKRFQVGGEYAQNPEDPAGNVQQATSTKVSVGTQLGLVGLTGSVARQVAAAGDEQRAGEVRVSLSIAAAHSLYTGYRQTQTLPLSGAAAGESDVYLLGYNYSVGGDFSLSLEGQMQRDRDLQQLRMTTQQTANAKLNWRF